MTEFWHSGGSFYASLSDYCEDPTHASGCPCRLGGEPVIQRVKVTNPDSMFYGFRGELRSVSEESGTRLVRLDGWTLDLPFGESELRDIEDPEESDPPTVEQIAEEDGIPAAILREALRESHPDASPGEVLARAYILLENEQ